MLASLSHSRSYSLTLARDRSLALTQTHSRTPLTNISLDIFHGEVWRGKLKAQPVFLGHGDGVTEAASLQVALRHLAPVHLQHNLFTTARQEFWIKNKKKKGHSPY